jgi:hypothetical protein
MGGWIMLVRFLAMLLLSLAVGLVQHGLITSAQAQQVTSGAVPPPPTGIVVPEADRAYCYRSEGVCIERYDDFMRNKRAEEIGAGLLVSMFDRIQTLEGELAEAKNAKRCAVLEVLPSKKHPWRGM